MAKILIQYYGITQDYTKTTSEEINFEGTVGELIQFLFKKYPPLNNKNFKVSINNNILNLSDASIQNTKLTDTHYNMLFLPPFAGG
ncbi:MAG: hypothetical protein Fur0023_21210 [Bacteroidia bacterium]